jgi:hypothetical protein
MYSSPAAQGQGSQRSFVLLSKPYAEVVSMSRLSHQQEYLRSTLTGSRTSFMQVGVPVT